MLWIASFLSATHQLHLITDKKSYVTGFGDLAPKPIYEYKFDKSILIGRKIQKNPSKHFARIIFNQDPIHFAWVYIAVYSEEILMVWLNCRTFAENGYRLLKYKMVFKKFSPCYIQPIRKGWVTWIEYYKLHVRLKHVILQCEEYFVWQRHMIPNYVDRFYNSEMFKVLIDNNSIAYHNVPCVYHTHHIPHAHCRCHDAV